MSTQAVILLSVGTLKPTKYFESMQFIASSSKPWASVYAQTYSSVIAVMSHLLFAKVLEAYVRKCTHVHMRMHTVALPLRRTRRARKQHQHTAWIKKKSFR